MSWAWVVGRAGARASGRYAAACLAANRTLHPASRFVVAVLAPTPSGPKRLGSPALR